MDVDEFVFSDGFFTAAMLTLFAALFLVRHRAWALPWLGSASSAFRFLLHGMDVLDAATCSAAPSGWTRRWMPAGAAGHGRRSFRSLSFSTV